MKTQATANLSKKKILGAALVKHESVMNGFRKRIGEITGSSEAENGCGHGKYNASLRIETQAELNLLREQLEFATHEWEELTRIESYCDIDHDRVEFGSVVVTDLQTFFVSANIEDFTVDGHTYFGLAVYEPLYSAMKEKHKGDSFVYAGRQYKIIDVF